MSPGSFASLRPDVYELLTSNYGARAQAFNAILDRWWPESLHADLRERLGMPEAAAFLPETVAAKRLARDRRFVGLVLENYRYSCAMCGFHALINGQSTGVDACHIKWHSARGPDTLANGIALCKMHHWAFDRGVVTLNEDLIVTKATSFVVCNSGGLRLDDLHGQRLAVNPREEHPHADHLGWHRQNVYLGS